MTNYGKEIAQALEQECDQLYQTYSDADKWTKSYLKYEELDQISVDIKKNRSKIATIRKSISSKPVFAIFGISQVGKSYLVQNILSVDGAPLQVNIGNHKYDFLGEINPAGNNAESTGVVTRFTIDPNLGTEAFPIQTKILSAGDLVNILADAFFSDISKLESYPTTQEFKDKIKELNEKYAHQSPCQEALTEDDIWNCAMYFKQNFKKYSQNIQTIESSGFWYNLGALIHKIPHSDWGQVFNLIWCKDDQMTQIFEHLINGLEALQFSRVVYIDQNAILRSKGAVLDVQQLDHLHSTSDKYKVQLANQTLVEIEIAKLSALTSEVTLNVDAQIALDKPFLQNTDLLDFPGARSREEFTKEMIKDLIVVRMFLRGKVSFLFNKYSSDFEINNLLFCLKDEKIEVNSISDLLYEWISNNIGLDENQREETLKGLPSSPLFIIMTFFNRQLAFDPVNDERDVSYKWDNRFRRFFEEQITLKYKWHTNWTVKQPNFSNFFFLRDFKYSTDTFERENGIETKIKVEREAHMQNLRTSFLENPFVQKHFVDPSKSWDLSATPNNDGSELIIEKLMPAASNYVKINKFSLALKEHRNELLAKLHKHHVSDNLDQKRKVAFKKSNEIGLSLLQLYGNASFNFPDFLNSLSVTDIDVYNIIHSNFLNAQKRQEPENYLIFKGLFPDISSSLSREENLRIICNQLQLDDIASTENYLKEKEIDLDIALENHIHTNATKLVDGVLTHWKEKLHIENFQTFINQGLEKSAMVALVDNLLETFEILGIRNELIELFEQKTKLINAPKDTEEYLSSLITAYINDFSANFGLNFMKPERVDEVLKIAEEFKIDLKLMNKKSHVEQQNTLLAIYDKMDSRDAVSPPLIDNFQLYVLKMKLAMISNCGFAEYNIDSNRSLSQIIEKMQQLEFRLSDK
jgi:hypothetical protein